MAITRIQFKDFAGGAGTTNFSFTNPIAANSVIAVFLGWDSGATTATITNDKSDPVTVGIAPIDATPLGFPVITTGVAFLTATTGAQTVTFTPSGGTSTFNHCSIWEVGGLRPGAKFDKTATNHGTASAATSGSTGTLSAAAEFAFAIGFSDSQFTAAGAGWNPDSVNGTGDGTLAESQIVAANTALTATGTQNGTFYYLFLATLMSQQAAVVNSVRRQTLIRRPWR